MRMLDGESIRIHKSLIFKIFINPEQIRRRHQVLFILLDGNEWVNASNLASYSGSGPSIYDISPARLVLAPLNIFEYDIFKYLAICTYMFFHFVYILITIFAFMRVVSLGRSVHNVLCNETRG